MDFSNLLKSKRFWAAAAVVAVVVLKDRVPLNEQQITEIVLAVGAWIVGESIRPVNPPPRSLIMLAIRLRKPSYLTVAATRVHYRARSLCISMT